MRFLKVNLFGPMQSWGGHTYENYRPTYGFPTRSAVTGLFAAALGIDRTDVRGTEDVDRSFRYAVREMRKTTKREGGGDFPLPLRKMVDYHTVRNVRTTTPGKVKDEITRREYLLDAGFVLMAASSGPEAPYSLDDLGNALRAPVFTLFLGRKACPPTVPFFGGYAEAPCVERALDEIATDGKRFCGTLPLLGGTVYSEFAPDEDIVGSGLYGTVSVRDLRTAPGKFLARDMYYFTLPAAGETE